MNSVVAIRNAPRVVVLGLLLILVVGLGACQDNHVPAPESEAYQEAVSAFYTGLAAIQVGENFRAEQHMRTAAEQAPGEPAVWANRGVLALRQGDLDSAVEHLERARDLSADDSEIQYLSGLLARERGQYDRAISYLRRAAELDSTNRAALYTLAQVIEQQGEEDAAEEALQLMDRLLEQEPGNLAVLVERARLATKAQDQETLQQTLDRLSEQASTWPEAVRTSFRDVQDAASSPSQATSEITFFENDLQRVAAYRVDRDVVQPPEEQIGRVVERFRRLETPNPRPAPPDTGLTFATDTLFTEGGWDWIHHVSLADEVPPDVMMIDGETLRVETGLGRIETMVFPGGDGDAPSAQAVTAFDMNYDFRVDLAAAGSGGMRLYRQASDSSFRDVTQEAIPVEARGAAYAGVWPADLDMDGDLDLVLAREDGAPVILRNNGDDTFETRSFFSEVEALRAFVWADIDADGTPDAALLDDAGRLHVYENRRSGTPRFQRRDRPEELGDGRALAVGDMNRDGQMDLLLLQADGTIQRLSLSSEGWSTDVLVEGEALSDDASVGAVRLLVGDFDNNGGLDLVTATPSRGRVWLSDADGSLQPLDLDLEQAVFSAADVRGEGRLDFMALSSEGEPLRLTNEGEKGYHSQRIQPRATRVQGDRRINPFGIGGEIELRSGLLYQKRPIVEPTVHFGIGERTGADVARIIWPNGTVQAEFDLLSTQTALARQRLKGSCPWVFTHDGDEMRFETDFLWRTALGLRINAQGEAQVIHSEDRVFIPGDHLAPKEGHYDVRITGELWESHFFDRVELMAVDHPTDAEVRIDERFHLPAPDQDLTAVDTPRPVAHAEDHEGQDVTDLVREKDGRYLDTFALGPFQGLAEEHYVEVELGDDVPRQGSGPLWLVADGWVYPTDTSINLAIGQGDHAPPQSITLEVPDGEGGWTVAQSDIGFPAGKSKTMLIDLSEALGPDAPPRVRLRTSMEIYWDRLAWATGRPETEVETHRLTPDSARLRYRGFSKVKQTERRLPEVPVYDSIASTKPIWRDLEGYHTRFGDVRELVTETDDRYVIMNAGDEMLLRFQELPPPPEGWTRDFVLIGDGWVKDGDFNTGYSRTVRPLPYHGLEDYSEPPVPLEEDPAYKKHPEDWERYHTRYVTPRPFHHALTVDQPRFRTP